MPQCINQPFYAWILLETEIYNHSYCAFRCLYRLPKRTQYFPDQLTLAAVITDNIEDVYFVEGAVNGDVFCECSPSSIASDPSAVRSDDLLPAQQEDSSCTDVSHANAGARRICSWYAIHRTMTHYSVHNEQNKCLTINYRL